MEGLTGASRLWGSGAPDSFVAEWLRAAPRTLYFRGPPSPRLGLSLSGKGARVARGFVTKA